MKQDRGFSTKVKHDASDRGATPVCWASGLGRSGNSSGSRRRCGTNVRVAASCFTSISSHRSPFPFVCGGYAGNESDGTAPKSADGGSTRTRTFYNFHRTPSAIGESPPIRRLDRHNVSEHQQLGSVEHVLTNILLDDRRIIRCAKVLRGLAGNVGDLQDFAVAIGDF